MNKVEYKYQLQNSIDTLNKKIIKTYNFALVYKLILLLRGHGKMSIGKGSLNLDLGFASRRFGLQGYPSPHACGLPTHLPLIFDYFT